MRLGNKIVSGVADLDPQFNPLGGPIVKDSPPAMYAIDLCTLITVE